jgi:putative acetyltransferase
VRLPEVSIADPRAEDVRRLLERHLGFAQSHVPPKDRHALDTEGLADADVDFYAPRLDRELLAVGALRKLDGGQAERSSRCTQPRRHVGKGSVERCSATFWLSRAAEASFALA